jgi:protein-disulfide isomerase
MDFTELDVFGMKKIGLPKILILCVITFASAFFGGFLGSIVLSKSAGIQPVQAQPQVQKRYEIPADGFPSVGPEDAPIVIVEFSDFQCPYCARFQDQTLQLLLEAYPGKIRFVYRHFPLASIHSSAFQAAEASMCAYKQGAFWPYHDELYANQATLGTELYVQLAADLRLDLESFRLCLKNEDYKELVQSDLDFAESLGVRSTPTFFINGLAFVGAQPLDAFKQVIDSELKGGGS